MTTSKL